jgi:tetratricopeptide (TPR) repeat protein
MRAAVVLALAVLAAPARADGGDPMDAVRKAAAAGDYEGVRAKLLEIYKADPKPQILFALGQAELNLGNYQAAIDYYEQFIATKPGDEQVALAQQAIGAARMRMAEPAQPTPDPDPPVHEEPLPPAPPPEHPEGSRWTLTRTGFVALGGAAMLVGGGLLLYSRSLGNDHSGTLSMYDDRIGQARTARWTGAGVVAAGTLLVGVTLVW